MLLYSVISALLASLNLTYSYKSKITMSSTNVHIIGAGPTGLAVALLLAKENISSIVYEGRSKIIDNVKERCD
jgi:NADPH-dependent glutamate synthase beta subunit-like oxidoreductase